LPNGVGEGYKDLDLNSKKIGNYDLNILKHQQARINDICDKIKSGEKKLPDEEVKKYFLVKFTLQAMELAFDRRSKEIENISKDEFNSHYLKGLCRFIKSQTNDGKDLEALKKFNIDSEEELYKLSNGISIRDLGKDKLEKIKSSEGFNFKGLSYSNYSDETLKNKSTALDIRELIHLTDWKTGYFALENAIAKAAQKEWLVKFDKGEYDPEKDHEEIKKLDEEFANILKDAFEPMKKLKEILEQEGKTAVEKLESISEAGLYAKGSKLPKLCLMFMQFGLYGEPNNTFKRFDDLKNEALKQVLSSINNLDFIDLDTDKKINLLKKAGSPDIAKVLSVACEIKRALTDKMPDVTTVEQKINYLNNKFGQPNNNFQQAENAIAVVLEKFGKNCQKHKIEDKVTPLFKELQEEYDKIQEEKEDQEEPEIKEEDQKQQALKEFLASFDLEKSEFNYDSLENKISFKNVAVLGNVKYFEDYVFDLDLQKLDQDKFDSMKSDLKAYVNLYKETFKDELKNLKDGGQEINKILDDLPNQIDQAGDNPNKIIAVGKCILFCIGTLCTGGILAFALFNKNVKNTVLTPIKKAKLDQIRNKYNETIKQIQITQKRIRGQGK